MAATSSVPVCSHTAPDAHALKAGTVYVNCYHIVDAVTPWGGYKQSGWGRELGPYALDLYTELKNVIVDIA